MQDEKFQELHEVIEYLNERQGKLVSTMERTQMLMGQVPGTSSNIMLRVLDDRISAEELELLEKLLKERRKTEVEEWRDKVVVEGWSYSEGSSWVSKLRR